MKPSSTGQAVGRIVALAVVGALAVAGCGTTKHSATAPTTTAPLGSTSATSTPTARGTSPAGVAPAPVESNPPGDIPDTVAFVRFRSAAGHYSFTHPEGWAEVAHGASAGFTDKLNGITAVPLAVSAVPTTASARRTDVPALRRRQPAFELRSVQIVKLPAGPGVLIVYRRNSAPDPVTGRVYRDEVARYEVGRAGRFIALELYGPVGSDNVDPWRTVSQSLRLT